VPKSGKEKKRKPGSGSGSGSKKKSRRTTPASLKSQKGSSVSQRRGPAKPKKKASRCKKAQPWGLPLGSETAESPGGLGDKECLLLKIKACIKGRQSHEGRLILPDQLGIKGGQSTNYGKTGREENPGGD